MNGIPEYGTGRHEDYLSQQDERAEAARDHQAEEGCAEWRGWMEANAYSTHPDDCEGMAEAFAAGMRAARELAAAQPKPAPELGTAWRLLGENRALLAEILGFLGDGIPPGDEFALQVAQWRERGLPS